MVHWHCICMAQRDKKKQQQKSLSTPYKGFIGALIKKLVVLALQTHVADGGSPQ